MRELEKSTLDDLLNYEGNNLPPELVAGFLGTTTHTLYATVRQKGERNMSFNCSFIGDSLRIPRLAFINWVQGGNGWSVWR